MLQETYRRMKCHMQKHELMNERENRSARKCRNAMLFKRSFTNDPAVLCQKSITGSHIACSLTSWPTPAPGSEKLGGLHGRMLLSSTRSEAVVHIRPKDDWQPKSGDQRVVPRRTLPSLMRTAQDIEMGLHGAAHGAVSERWPAGLRPARPGAPQVRP
jgi:hypothetical protein